MLLALHIYKNKQQTKIAPIQPCSFYPKGIIVRVSTILNLILQNFIFVVFVKFLQHFTTSPPPRRFETAEKER